MKPGDIIDAAKLAGLLVVGYLAWRAYKSVKDLPGEAWQAVEDWGSSFGQVPAYTPQQIETAQEAFAAWKPGRGNVKQPKKAAEPSRQATQADTVQWQQNQADLFGGWSFDQLRTGGYSPFGLY